MVESFIFYFVTMPTFEWVIEELRAKGKKFAEEIKELSSSLKVPREAIQWEDIGEEIANAMLAYRHAEDAVMRLWKILQARAGWVSVYDKK